MEDLPDSIPAAGGSVDREAPWLLLSNRSPPILESRMPVADLVDPDLFLLFQALAGALVQYTPQRFRSARCLIEQAPGHGKGRLQYCIGSADAPDESTIHPSADLHQAAYRLYQYWTRNGSPFPPTELTVEQQPDGTWRSNIRRLDLLATDLPGQKEPDAEEQWQTVYRAREELFTAHFGPLPGEIQKLMNLFSVWPGGGLFTYEAAFLGGLGICTSFGLTNADMPTPVQLTDSASGPDQVTTQLTGRVPRWVVPHLAGYGYEVMVLTPTRASWPLLSLSWLVQMEILRDLDLLSHVEQGNGATLEGIRIGDSTRTADFLITPAAGFLPAQMQLPNGTLHLLVATWITRDEMHFAQSNGRPALLELLRKAGVGQMSVLDRPSVLR